MPQIELSAQVALPASLVGPELLRLLEAIQKGDPPHANFAVSVDLSSLHLPGAGKLSIPVSIKLARAPASALRIDFEFHAHDAHALFPAFNGSLRTDPEGPSKSRVWLVGEYTPPMGAAGMVLDRTVLSSTARSSLDGFLETLVASAQSGVQRREMESIRSERFNQ